MPAWLLALTSVTFITGVIVKVLAAMGLGFFALTGVDYYLSQLTIQIEGYTGSLPVNAVALVKMSGIYTIIHWIISAYAFRVTLQAGRMIFGSTRHIGGITQ